MKIYDFEEIKETIDKFGIIDNNDIITKVLQVNDYQIQISFSMMISTFVGEGKEFEIAYISLPMKLKNLIHKKIKEYKFNDDIKDICSVGNSNMIIINLIDKTENEGE